MKQRPFAVLDRDGTVNVERHYLADPAQLELLPNAASGLRELSAMGFGLVVVTNQSAVNRGFFDMSQLNLIHTRLHRLLEAEGVRLDGIYFCPHTPDEGCQCRKPRPGLINLAAQELGFDPKAGLVIGDKACDIELGRLVGATTVLVRTGYGVTVGDEIKPDYVVDDLRGAARIARRLLAKAERGVTDRA